MKLKNAVDIQKSLLSVIHKTKHAETQSDSEQNYQVPLNQREQRQSIVFLDTKVSGGQIKCFAKNPT